MTAKVIDGKAFAANVRAQVAEHVARLREENGLQPGLAVVLVGEDPASKVYVKNKHASTVEVGMASFEHRLDASTGEAELLALIDIGINRVDGKTVGDADFASCKDVAGWITPVPGGVGPVTVAILMKNAVLATAMQMDHYRTAFAAAV